MDELRDEYLWQRTGPIDDFVRELETLLGPLRYEAREAPFTCACPPPPPDSDPL